MTDDVALALRAIVETGLLLCDAFTTLEPSSSPSGPVIGCETIEDALQALRDRCDLDD